MANDAMPFALISQRVVLPHEMRAAAVLVDWGRIAAIVDPADVPSGCAIEDLGNLVIAPGLVDAHVHVNEPGRTHWEGFETATRAAAAGGITTLIDMPLNSSPVTTTVAALAAKREAAMGKCIVDVGFYGGLIPGNADQVVPLLDAGVLGIKAFLCDSGLPEFPPAQGADLRAALPHLAMRQRPLLAHAELTRSPAPAINDPRSYREYLASRPPVWENEAIEMLIGLCREFKGPVHIVHLANGDALPMLREAKAAGLPITVETCPHYLHFAAEDVPDGDTRFKCAPPIRQRRHRELLWAALTAGLIDTIGSDHSPCPPDMKKLQAGDFASAWGGIASLQLTLPIVWTDAARRGVGMTRIFDCLSAAPARLLRLPHKGRIAAGCDADLVVWDPEVKETVNGHALQHRHKVTPYEGHTLMGRVCRTYLRGSLIYRDGEVADGPRGELLMGG